MISIIQPRLPGELAATVASFPVDIPVEPGDLIGLETGSGAGGDYPEGPRSGTPADVRGDVLGAPTTGQTVGTGGEYAVEGLTGYLTDIATTLTATTAPLTVAKTGTGAGAVTSLPAGIDCGALCSASFDLGSTIGLDASPMAGSVFSGWSGAGCTARAAVRSF